MEYGVQGHLHCVYSGMERTEPSSNFRLISVCVEDCGIDSGSEKALNAAENFQS